MAMSGLFGEAEVFADVADKWALALTGPYPPGRIRYFKMDEACGLSGEFQYWKEQNRDDKVQQMARVIDRTDLLEIAAWFDLEAFAKVSARWEHIKGKHAMKTPYINLFNYVMNAAISEAVDRGCRSPIEVVFDEQASFRPVMLAGWNDIRDNEDMPERRAVMPIHPSFRDDMDFIVLQAADLLAGNIRLMAERVTTPSFIGALCPNLPRSKYCADLNGADFALLEDYLKTKAEYGGVNEP